MLEQVVDALTGLGRHRDERRVAAVLLGHHLVAHQFLLDAIRVGLGLSILFIATTSGTPAAFACAIASLVCGITPSSAATTRITMSVALAPRARIAVNASWPGVSRKVTMPRGVFT
jgi:hypothetical protein